MMLAQVKGSIVSTIQHPAFEGRKIMVVQPGFFVDSTKQDVLNDSSNKAIGKIKAIGTIFQPTAKEFLALDFVQAGVGDTVLVSKEGGASKIVYEANDAPVHAVILGIVDSLDAD